uniref:DUF4709 domain-containing protein n=1 Tax=Syphacia muris TaxID=451379 RepID=A0A0N5AF97_9BILA
MEQNNHSEFEESLFDDDVTPKQRCKVKSGVLEASLSEPFLHEYVDMLENLFSKARSRIDELNCMAVSSGVVDRFEVMSFSSGRQTQFQGIKNLSLECAQSMLRAEMLKVEHNNKVIDGLQKRILDLEQRLTVTETAENYYSRLMNSVEKMLKQLLEDITDVEKRRAEKAVVLVERNEKLEKKIAILKEENRKLNCRIEEQMDKVQKLEKELHSTELNCKTFRNQVDMLNSNMASVERENQDLSSKLSNAERDLQLRKETIRKLNEQVRTLDDKGQQLSAHVTAMEKTINEKELDFRRKLDLEVEMRRREHVAELSKQKSMHEADIAKLYEETKRVKRERDGLVAKVCDYENNMEAYKRQIYTDAQEKFARGCQLVVNDLAESAASTVPVNLMRTRSVLGNPGYLNSQHTLPSSTFFSENESGKKITEVLKSLRKGSSATDFKNSKRPATSLSSRAISSRKV